MKHRMVVRVGLVAFLLCGPPVIAATRYAKVSATGAGDCSSWANACVLGDPALPGTALAVAAAGDQVWVQAGTYPPFDLKEGVKLIGGFAGTETAASQSNPATNATIIDGGDVARCLYGEDLTTATVIRGFTIRNGYADDYGGALLIYDSSPVFVNCLFEYNTAQYVAGTVFARGLSTPQFHNCTFRYNGATTEDGPYGGGAIMCDWDAGFVAVNCLFHDNVAGDGGAVFIGGGNTESKMVNCTFANNRAHWNRGGAIWDGYGKGILQNCILWGNTAARVDVPSDQIYNYALGAYYGPTSVSSSDVQGGWVGTGNIDADPLFGAAGGGGFLISTSSPCKNTGSNDLLPLDVVDLDWDGNVTEVLPKDIQNLVRIRATIVDMGAFEALTGGGGGGG